LDPNARFPIVLASDQEKPEPRPTFWARYLTGREWIELTNNAGESAIASWYNALRLAIVHWEHLADADGRPIPFAPAMFENILDPGEARELVEACIAGQQPDTHEKKGSASPSPSRPANSAGRAGRATAPNTPPKPVAGHASTAPTAPGPAAPPAMDGDGSS
jgi:hypothetical protein